MIVLGLNFGHDASVTVLEDGAIRLHRERERSSRVRHVDGLTADFILRTLDLAGARLSDVDYCAVTTSQTHGYMALSGDRLAVRYDYDAAETLPEGTFSRRVFDSMVETVESVADRFNTIAVERFEAQAKHLAALEVQPHPENQIEAPGLPQSTPNIEVLARFGAWDHAYGKGSERASHPAALRLALGDNPIRKGLYAPVTVTLDGVAMPGVSVSHHLSHAAAAFFLAPASEGFIVSLDNGMGALKTGYIGGMVFYGRGTDVFPLWSAPYNAGTVYLRTSQRLNLGGLAGPGKLMGLSSYGSGAFHHDRFVGDYTETADAFMGDARPTMSTTVDNLYVMIPKWLEHLWEEGRKAGLDVEDLSPEGLFAREIAGSTQRLFEAQMTDLVAGVERMRADAGLEANILCMVGGCALNCPTNTMIERKSRFERVFVPPNCDDSGLSAGAALFLHHTLLGRPRVSETNWSDPLAMMGRSYTDDTLRKAAEADGSATVTALEDPTGAAAADIAAGDIVGWFDGASEAGPRALGARSILADPRVVENWERVNRIKGRELWRPFAPACLEDRMSTFFAGGPATSPHMLFTYSVKGSELPAITHVDGSARAQSVPRGSGRFADVLARMEDRTGMPIVLNTSFNGPGEPIVDTPEDALRFLSRGGLDTLYMGGARITRSDVGPRES